jgi:preprotein translocase subunit SecA
VLTSFLKFIFGTANNRTLKRIEPIVLKINSFEESFNLLNNEDFKIKTNNFKERISKGESLDSIMPEAYALAREAAKRALGQRYYDVQLIGGIVLNSGKIAEMKTGEGKTLTATMPLYLNALSGKGSHLVTVNDYLAKRDSEWMSPIYNLLGVTVGALQNNMCNIDRKKIYDLDIVYGTNSEFGFDYLKDNMKFRLSDYVQRSLNFAIVDEVDSILIDEARTPLIISGESDEESVDLVKEIDKIIKKLTEKIDYEIDEKERNVVLTDSGIDKVESSLNIKSGLFQINNIQYLHFVNQSLKANTLFKKDVDYVNWKGEILIVDEFTGRILQGRRYSDGLHQAIEAKENVEIERETQTLASITLQNYFRLYSKLAGMTGTALTEAEEFHKIYNLDVVSIPTNKKMIRADKPDFIFLTEKAKFKNIVTDIKARYEKKQPVLIGTVAIETSERLSDELNKFGIPHEILNAKQHEREAEIIAHAGEPAKITIATNMAGRGTDIKLTEEAKLAGGLYILGTERHENRRIDNQLRGRSGRQGDNGETRFYISLDDTLIRRFGRDSVKNCMLWAGMKEDEVIEDEMISSAVETAQEKVEKHNFEIRKQLIEYDDVLNQQRIIIYALRRAVISGGEELMSTIKEIFYKYIEQLIIKITEDGKKEIKILNENEKQFFYEELKNAINIDIDQFNKIISLNNKDKINKEISKLIYNLYLHKSFSELNENISENKEETKKEFILEAQKWFILEELDHSWRQHIVNLDHIREGIGLRGYGQKTPLIEYKYEAFELFKRMTTSLIEKITKNICDININNFNKVLLEEKRERELEEIEAGLKEQHEEKEEGPRNRKERRKKKTK